MRRAAFIMFALLLGLSAAAEAQDLVVVKQRQTIVTDPAEIAAIKAEAEQQWEAYQAGAYDDHPDLIPYLKKIIEAYVRPLWEADETSAPGGLVTDSGPQAACKCRVRCQVLKLGHDSFYEHDLGDTGTKDDCKDAGEDKCKGVNSLLNQHHCLD